MSMSSIVLLGIASEHPTRMTVLEALAILEAAVLECKKTYLSEFFSPVV
jgi:hypothetical protein